MLLKSKYVGEEVKSYLMRLYAMLIQGNVEQWYEKVKLFIDCGCYIDPTFWDLAYEDLKKLKEILELCIKLKNCLEKNL